ncbi:hypothetical protein C1645_833638 [Glomus cerebriforme]|uniref:Uncharacterized protein n=1 Tax=Glomus cerebriforme TaxID=658196 RepID=A0A397SDJ0_9GLOM|nr:hypothetical protein C1645_833638 [Glomus cerebriforme]
MVDEGTPAIEIIIKVSKNEKICFDKQHVGLLDEISEFVKKFGSLNVTLSKPIKDTGFEMHGFALEKAFDLHTIFQSSGYEKSWLIKKMAKDIPTIYICLQDAKSTGYPLRTNVGTDLFERVLRDLKFCNKVWTDVQKRSANWNNIEFKNVINLVDFLTNKNSNDDVCFLLCINEARVLISPTTEYTLSRISNFTHPKLIDPSSWDTTDLFFKLFYLYFQLTTMDIFIDSNNNYDDEYKNLEDRERLIIAYSSEPLLSEIALDLVKPRPRGELVIQIILAVVIHKLKRNKPKNTVRKFLKELYHHDSLPKITDKNYPTSVKSKLNSNYVFKKSNLKDYNKKCLCLYWQLSYHGHDQEVSNHISTHQNPVPKNLYWASFGLDYFNIDNNIIVILTNLLAFYILPFDSEWQVHNEEKGDIWKKFAEMREAFQALHKSKQDIFLMAQLIVIDSGIISNRIGRNYFENIRNHLINNGFISRIHGNEEEIKDLLKEYKDYLAKARLERNYYNKNTKLAIKQRKLIDQNYLLINNNTNPRKVHLFGIQNEAIYQQINYVFDENELLKKDPKSIIKAQAIANRSFYEFNLLKIKKANISKIIKKIKALFILVLTPSPLDYKCQEYLYNNIHPFIKNKYKDITYLKPI